MPCGPWSRWGIALGQRPRISKRLLRLGPRICPYEQKTVPRDRPPRTPICAAKLNIDHAADSFGALSAKSLGSSDAGDGPCLWATNPHSGRFLLLNDPPGLAIETGGRTSAGIACVAGRRGLRDPLISETFERPGFSGFAGQDGGIQKVGQFCGL